ncbi:MAG TPA: GNAT family N-acetyltransferase [Nevskiaceae bacterium]
MKLRSATPADDVALRAFAAALDARDRTFLGDDPSVCAAPESPGVRDHPLRWIATADDRIIGYASLRRLPAHSRHVGILRLAVASGHRRSGTGTDLARHALVESLHEGVLKVVVEIAAEQEPVIRMFRNLGFSAEALLRDQLRDENGSFHDLLMLAHHARADWSAMDTVGLTGELD